MKENKINNISPLYKEALLEVEQYKEIATKEAEKAIIEAIAPLIKEELNKNLKTVSEAKSLIKEEEEDPFTSQTPPADVPVDSSTMPPTQPDSMNVQTSAPPITSAPAGLNVPLPDASGKIVIDLADLFAATPEGQEPSVTGAQGVSETIPTTELGGFPSETSTTAKTEPLAPVETTPAKETENPFGEEIQPEGLSYENFKESVERLQTNILGRKILSLVQKDSFKQQIFEHYENLERIARNKKVSEKIATLEEKRLNGLYKHIVESAKKDSIYSKIIKDNIMGQKREDATTALAKKLFENVSAKGTAGFGDSPEKPKFEKELDKSNSSGKHAIATSDSKNVKDPGKKKALTVEALTESEEALALEAELKEMFGDDECSSEEVTTEAAEIVADKTADKAQKLSPGKSVNTHELAVMEAKKAKKAKEEKQAKMKKKVKALQEEQARIQKALKECALEEEVIHGTGTITIDLNVNSEDEDMEGSEVELHDLGDEDEFEVVNDDGSELEDMDSSDSDMGEDEDLDSMESEPSLEDEDEEEEVEEAVSPVVPESVKRASNKLVLENKKLKADLADHELLTARALCVSKLFTNEGLSFAQKRKISEYVDMATSINEVKEVYTNIKKILEEKKKTSTTVGSGSSSAPTNKGSANTKALNESVVADDYAPTKSRWMHLAGISQKSQ